MAANYTSYISVGDQSTTSAFILQLFLPSGPQFFAIDELQIDEDGGGYGFLLTGAEVGAKKVLVVQFSGGIHYFIVARSLTHTEPHDAMVTRMARRHLQKMEDKEQIKTIIEGAGGGTDDTPPAQGGIGEDDEVF